MEIEMSRKFIAFLIGCAFIFIVALFWLITGQTDPGLWAVLSSMFTLVFGAYLYSNVKQKEVISKNYKPELDDKNENL